MDENKGENSVMPETINNSKNVDDTLTNKMRENPWMLATFILGMLTLVLFVASLGGVTGSVITGNVVSQDTVSADLLNFFESMGVSGLEIESVGEMSGVYQVNFSYQGQTVPYYVTRDGKLAGSLTPITVTEDTSSSSSGSTTTDVPKTDKPVMELFVMSYCPYGTQAEKGFIPFIEAFGDSVDATIRFVHYTMHGEPEEQENARQICIREEQADKFIPYMKCFLSGNGVVDDNYGLIMEGKDQTTCMNEVGVDVSKVEDCISSGRADDYYTEDSKLSQQYGVQGSPTLVVNGVIADSGRSAAAYLDTACKAFNNAPETCGTLSLSTTDPTPYFGWDEAANTGSSTGSMCG